MEPYKPLLSLLETAELLNFESKCDKRRYYFQPSNQKNVIQVNSHRPVNLAYIYNIISTKSNWHVDRFGDLSKIEFPEGIKFKVNDLSK